jgi:aminoglycoside phosphotransferase family enzyme/predicted kinase
MRYDQAVLIESLKNPACYKHPVETVTVIETHISYVLLTGGYAYKIKKPLDLGFLDFSTLDKRLFYCTEELRLNRRLAPRIYLEVVPISGPTDRPQVGGTGQAIEYAVKMVQFSQDGMLDALLQQDQLPALRIDELAVIMAAFHAALTPEEGNSPYGSFEAVREFTVQNFDQIGSIHADALDLSSLSRLRDWTESELERRKADIQARRSGGFVRECHGDLHLGNVTLIDDRIVVFDCIEFNPGLRWIDVMNEAAFMAMDLQARSRGDCAARFLNRYLELTGDYGGVSLLRFYLVYRAMVRAKVNWIRSHQDVVKDAVRAQASEKYHRYLRLAQQYLDHPSPALIITHGLSGSGKTTFTQPVLEALGAIRIRSDIERKRLFQFPSVARTGAGIAEGIYGTDAGDRTYKRLAELTALCLQAGWPVIVDATFLERQRRDSFRRVAEKYDVPFLILDFRASESSLKARVRARSEAASDASDADLAVLQHQIANYKPLSDDEAAFTLGIDTERMNGVTAVEQIRELLAA